VTIECVSVDHHARIWALEGITQHSLTVTGVAGDHLKDQPLRYVATHTVTQGIHGYFEAKYFWGVLWVRQVWVKHKDALAELLYRVALDIQKVGIHRIILVTESEKIQTYLKVLGVVPVYGPNLSLHRPGEDFDQRYVFDYSCGADLLYAVSAQKYTITSEEAKRLDLFNLCLASSKTPYAWVAKSPEGTLVGYIELGIHKHQGYLRLLYTDPYYRQQGIARALVKTAMQYGTLQNCRLFSVETLSYQAPGFYEKQGFSGVFAVEGLRAMCVSTPYAIPKISDPLSFIFLTRSIS
jgi:ribosomal protein S18 acetylase RimI-like enzyme